MLILEENTTKYKKTPPFFDNSGVLRPKTAGH